MWRTLLLAGLMAGIATLARAQEPSWRICQGGLGADGPVLTDCRPIDGVIDPQGREIWIRATVPAPIDGRPHALYVAGVASSEAWLNGQPLGANGRPGPSARLEAPGRYQIGLPIRETAWRSGGNDLVLHMSSFHGGLRFDRPIMAATVGPYPYPTNLALLAVTFVAAGALMAAAFGFGVIHALRRTASSLVLAAMAGVAALQAVVESLRSLFAYPYPLHAWRMGAIWALSAAFSVMLVAYVAGRFLPGGRRRMVALALVAVGATALAPGFDLKTGSALLVGVLLALVAAAVGVRRRQPGAPATLRRLVAAVLVVAVLLLGVLLGDLVAGDRAQRAAQQGAFGLVAVTRDDGAERAAADGADHRALVAGALGALAHPDLVGARLGFGRGDGHGGRREAEGDDDGESFQMGAHGDLPGLLAILERLITLKLQMSSIIVGNTT
jgi:hypothetical protein